MTESDLENVFVHVQKLGMSEIPEGNRRHDQNSGTSVAHGGVLGVPDIREADGRNDLFSGDGTAVGGKLGVQEERKTSSLQDLNASGIQGPEGSVGLIQSFDIGIKNMAYCTLAVDQDQNISIVDWQTLDLRNDSDTNSVQHTCTCAVGKIKNGQRSLCHKKAKYHQPSSVAKTPEGQQEQYFCQRHALMVTKCATASWMMQEKRFHRTTLNKMKVEELRTLANEFHIQWPEQPRRTKQNMIDGMDRWFSERCLHVIPVTKKKTCDTVDLITVGRNMTMLLDRIPRLDGLTHVIMENQISPIAGRMKTIQGMLMQYYIMRYPQTKIAFISSANKLKVHTEIHKSSCIQDASRPSCTPNTPPQEVDNETNYRQHKRDAVYYTMQWLQQPRFQNYVTFFQENQTKKDDLADCFLQGLWFIGKKGTY